MSLPAPYLADTPQLLRTSIGIDYSVTAVHPSFGTLELDVERCTLTWDEARTPRVSCAVQARVPDSQAVLDALDPRAGVRLEVRAGYVRPDGVRDVHLIADLMLRTRTVARPGDVVVLGGQSDEAVLLETILAAGINPSSTSTVRAIRDVVEAGLGRVPSWSINVTDSAPVGVLHVSDEAGDLWTVADSESDRIGADLFDDGLRRWRLITRPTFASQPALELIVGEGGTITRSGTELTREGFHNAVLIRCLWIYAQVTGAAVTYTYKSITGRAAVTAGPYTAVPGNRVTLVETVDYGVRYSTGDPITTDGANAIAASKLRRGLSRGRSLTLEAVAALWARPGQTVTAQLPTGGLERHLIAAVTFDLDGGSMAVTTRRPDNDSTITQGA